MEVYTLLVCLSCLIVWSLFAFFSEPFALVLRVAALCFFPFSSCFSEERVIHAVSVYRCYTS